MMKGDDDYSEYDTFSSPIKMPKQPAEPADILDDSENKGNVVNDGI